MASEIPDSGSVSQWIDELRHNKQDAATKIWERFVGRLVNVANRRIRGASCRIADGETIVADAFKDFFNRSPEDFDKLINRNDLWQILVMITERRAIDAIRFENNQRRGGGRVMNEASLGGKDDSRFGLIDSMASGGDPPEVELMMIEALEDRLNSLGDQLLRQIAIDKMEGSTNAAIAEKRKISLRSVERKLAIIRKNWLPDTEQQESSAS